MFKDELRSEVWDDIRQHGIRAFDDHVTPATIADAARRTGVTIVASPLNLANLVWLGIAAAINVGVDFATVLTETLRVLEDQPGFSSTPLGKEKQLSKRRKSGKSKHRPHRPDRTVVSEEAFVKARSRMPVEFWFNLIIVLVELFEQEHRSLVTFRGFRLLAIDGTDINLPNWPALRKHFGTAKNRSGPHHALGRMVMLQMPTVRLPFRYELAPRSDGEVTIARRLTKHLQANDLLLMDAGYWSYGLFWDIQNAGAFFCIRLRAGIGLKRIGKLGVGDELWRWSPKDSRGQWRKEGLPSSLDVRVIRYQIPGFRPQQLVTNVLSPKRIPRADWVRLTTECEEGGRLKPGLYHRRWQIETTFRELLVEQALEKKLRSRTPDSIQYEVAGHVVLYLLVRWLIVEAAVKHGLDPLQLSFLHALRHLKEMRRDLIRAEPSWARTLLGRLLDRIAGHRVPYRPGRHYKRRKKSTNHKSTSRSGTNLQSQSTVTTKRSTKRKPSQKTAPEPKRREGISRAGTGSIPTTATKRSAQRKSSKKPVPKSNRKG